jgi:hypothetical protein
VFGQQASSFEQLQVLVKPDDTVVVTEFSGSMLRGKIAALSSSSLRLLVNGMPRDFMQSDVLEITQRRGDSLANGAIIGAVAGGAFGSVGAFIACLTETGCGRWIAVLVGSYAVAGTGVGVVTDALIVRQQTVYRAPPRSSARIRVAPLLSRGRRGVSISLSL